MVWKVRRVVTGHDDQGRSTFLFDDQNGRMKEMDSMPGLALTDIWETTSTPASNAGADDAAGRPVRLEPLPGGSIFRIVEFPPDTVWMGKVDPAIAFESIGAGDVHDSASDDPLRHKTNTIDYIIILQGEIDAVLDSGSVRLRQGDALVQRGTVHSWSVKGDEPCILAVVLINAVPAP
ncbi:cupin domain-containing protein [Sphingosinicella xenopeptidilytica]|uniref:Cupin domain-containing protein n=1 Tax=Sphingosinicella xenopeptidilytica TaxID=364098 RepID=A0ABW3BYI4_SPHXN